MKMNQSTLNLFQIASGMLFACVMLYLMNLIHLFMWYNKEAVHVHGKDYVQEVTRWSGHTRVVNIPVYHGG